MLLRLGGGGQMFLLALQAGFGLAFLFGGQRPALLVAIALVAIIVLVATILQLAYLEPAWLARYTHETEARQLIERLSRQDPVPNVSLQPTFVPVRDYDSAADQLRLGTIMLGRGWYAALVAGFILGAVGCRCARAFQAASLAAVVALMGAATVLYPPLAGVRTAEHIRSTGLLNGNDWQACATAYRHNPALAGAVPFLLTCAEALDRATGGRHPLTRLPDWWNLRERITRASTLDASAWARLEREYQEVLALAPKPATLQAALSDLARALHAQILVQAALRFADEGEFGRAQALLERAQPGQPDPDIAFFMLRNAVALRDRARSQLLAEWLDAHVAHRPLLADAHCLLGDAWTWEGAIQMARQAYLDCRDLDKTYNYRVVKALSGT
jgi:hypothetical protein